MYALLTCAAAPATAVEIDTILHRERQAAGNPAQQFWNLSEHLPDGTFVTDDEENAYLLLENRALRWTPAG